MFGESDGDWRRDRAGQTGRRGMRAGKRREERMARGLEVRGVSIHTEVWRMERPVCVCVCERATTLTLASFEAARFVFWGGFFVKKGNFCSESESSRKVKPTGGLNEHITSCQKTQRARDTPKERGRGGGK